MNLLVLSDLHIDTGDNFGLFQWSDEEFVECLENTRQIHSIDKVVLNGDVFELLKYSFKEIAEARPVLTRYLLNNDFIMLNGNHDLMNPHGRENYRLTNLKGQIIHIEHGHRADWLDGSLMGRALSRIMFYILKKVPESGFMRKFYLSSVNRNEGINEIPKYNTLSYQSYALKKLKDVDLVILGHTHILESHQCYYLNRRKRYINCGTCSLGRFEGIILDTETMAWELIKETKESVKEKVLITNVG